MKPIPHALRRAAENFDAVPSIARYQPTTGSVPPHPDGTRGCRLGIACWRPISFRGRESYPMDFIGICHKFALESKYAERHTMLSPDAAADLGSGEFVACAIYTPILDLEPRPRWWEDDLRLGSRCGRSGGAASWLPSVSRSSAFTFTKVRHQALVPLSWSNQSSLHPRCCRLSRRPMHQTGQPHVRDIAGHSVISSGNASFVLGLLIPLLRGGN